MNAPEGWQNVPFDDKFTSPRADSIQPFSWPSLDGRMPPPRRFIVEEWIPCGCVTSLYGPGGIGKSLLAQLLATTAASGRNWLGFTTERGRVLALFCEDDANELWRRQVRINEALGIGMGDLVDFLPDARVGRENALVWTEGTRLVEAPLLDQLRTKVAELRPALVILDNIAQHFAGNENDRSHVTAFVNKLAGIARDHDCAVLLLGHVAKVEGSTYSGSTAWDAAVRSRLMFERVESEDKAPGLRLSRVKSNYATNDSVELIWRDSVIVPADPRFMTSADVLAAKLRAGEVEQRFLDALDTLRAQGRAVSESPQARTYAPRVIIEAGLAGDANKGELAQAMATLFTEGRIVANQPVLRGANRHAKTGIARRTWLNYADQSAEQQRAQNAVNEGCAARSCVPLDRGDTLERSSLDHLALQSDGLSELERNQSAELKRRGEANALHIPLPEPTPETGAAG